MRTSFGRYSSTDQAPADSDLIRGHTVQYFVILTTRRIVWSDSGCLCVLESLFGEFDSRVNEAST